MQAAAADSITGVGPKSNNFGTKRPQLLMRGSKKSFSALKDCPAPHVSTERREKTVHACMRFLSSRYTPNHDTGSFNDPLMFAGEHTPENLNQTHNDADTPERVLPGLGLQQQPATDAAVCV